MLLDEDRAVAEQFRAKSSPPRQRDELSSLGVTRAGMCRHVRRPMPERSHSTYIPAFNMKAEE
jgi:hypothetical protein